MVRLDMIRNWIALTGVAFLGIGGGLIVFKWLAGKNIPVVSSLANGLVSFWRVGQ